MLTVSPCGESLVLITSLAVDFLLLEDRAIDIQSKANLVSGQSSGAIFAPNDPRSLHACLLLNPSVSTMELLVLTSSRQFPKLCMSMALLQAARYWGFSYRDRPGSSHGERVSNESGCNVEKGLSW